MKIITKLAIIILVAGFFSSCDSVNDNTVLKKTAREDSIAQANENARILNQTLQKQLSEMTNRYVTLKADLDSAKSNIGKLNDCQFWMTKAECEKQAQDLTTKIQSLEKEVAEVGQQAEITSIKLKQVEQELASK